MEYAVDLNDYPDEVIDKFMKELESKSSICWVSKHKPTQFKMSKVFRVLSAGSSGLCQGTRAREETLLTRSRFIEKMAELYPVKKQDIREYCKEHRVWAAKDGDEKWYWYKNDDKPGKLTSMAMWSSDDISRDDTFTTYTHNLSSEKFTFPSVPWDKSLIAPDGSMPMWDRGKNEIRVTNICFDPDLINAIIGDFDKGKEQKRATYFEAGKWYVNVGDSSSIYISEQMEEMFDRKPRKCTYAEKTVDGRKSQRASFDGIRDGMWYWVVDDFIEVDPPKGEKKSTTPHRGDPIFVWDDNASDRIPATVRYFSRIDGSLFVRVLSQTEENKEDEEDAFNHYRIYDASLVEVPRRKWPKQ